VPIDTALIYMVEVAEFSARLPLQEVLILLTTSVFTNLLSQFLAKSPNWRFQLNHESPILDPLSCSKLRLIHSKIKLISEKLFKEDRSGYY
jgi:hypothetical protein